MTTDNPGDSHPDAADESETDSADNALFDLDPPVRPYDIHLESVSAAAAALSQAQDAVRAAEEQLAQVMLQGRHAGLSWAKIAERLGTSRQNVYQRWATRLREIDNPATRISEPENHSELPFDH